MKYVGYHRVSSRQQNLDRGVDEIIQFCKEKGISLHKNKVYTDKSTGRNFVRPSYIIVKEELLEPGDILIISELDRLGRNRNETLKELRYFKDYNIRVMILEIPTTLYELDRYESSMAKMLQEFTNNILVDLYAVLSQAEMEKREKRQREGIEQKKARGEWGNYGRPRAIDFEEFCRHYERVVRNEIRPTELYREMRMAKSTFYAYKKKFEESRI